MSALESLRDAFEHVPGASVSVGVRVRLGRREDADAWARSGDRPDSSDEAGMDKPGSVD